MQSKQYLFTAWLCCFSFVVSFAQSFPDRQLNSIVTGSVDAVNNKKTLSNVTIEVRELVRTQHLKINTDENAFFEISVPSGKLYQFTFIMEGYQEKTIQFAAADSVVELGRIKLASASDSKKQSSVFDDEALLLIDEDTIADNFVINLFTPSKTGYVQTYSHPYFSQHLNAQSSSTTYPDSSQLWKYTLESYLSPASSFNGEPADSSRKTSNMNWQNKNFISYSLLPFYIFPLKAVIPNMNVSPAISLKKSNYFFQDRNTETTIRPVKYSVYSLHKTDSVTSPSFNALANSEGRATVWQFFSGSDKSNTKLLNYNRPVIITGNKRNAEQLDDFIIPLKTNWESNNLLKRFQNGVKENEFYRKFNFHEVPANKLSDSLDSFVEKENSTAPKEVYTDTKPVTYSITGLIIDSLSEVGLSYVTISLKEAGSIEIIDGTFSKEEGSFEFVELPAKPYQLVFSYVGYETKVIQIPEGDAEVIDLGEIPLTSAATQLEEIQVVAEKLLLEQDMDKVTYHVEDDPDSKSMMALDMLQKIPLLALDGEDNLMLNGSSSYQILINGRRSSMFVNSASEVFRSMPASIIKRIEVVTNPPSRYDAEGIGGIINVITHGKNIQGYSGSVNMGVRNPKGFTQSGYLTTKSGRLGFSGNFGNNISYNPTTRQNFFREDKIRGNRLEQIGEANSQNTFQYGGGELSYEPGELDLITANVSLNLNKGSSDFTQIAQLWNENAELTEAYRRMNSGKNTGHGNDLGLDYQRSFKRSSTQLLTLSYNLSNNFGSRTTNFILHPILNHKGRMSYTNNDDGTTEHTMQADYVHPVHHQIVELGIKSIYRQNDSRYFYKTHDPETNDYILDTRLSNDFDYRQHILAAYTSISLTKNAWGLRAGARMERTTVNAQFISSDTDVNQNYFNVIPNVTLSRRVKRSGNLRLSYSQRIERPGLYYLDPYIDMTDPRNISYGNPELNPALSHVFQLTFQSFVKSASINTSFIHSFTNNAIEQFTILGADSVSRTTFANIGRSQNYGVSLTGNTTLFKKLNLNLNSSAQYMLFMRLIDGESHYNEGFRFNISGSATYRFKGWSSSGNVGYSSPNIMVQGRSAGNFWNTISLTKQFLKEKKARISFSIKNPFQKFRQFYNEVNEPSFRQVSETYRIMRRYNVSLSYRFGKLRGDIARKRRGINNDDLKAVAKQSVEN